MGTEAESVIARVKAQYSHLEQSDVEEIYVRALNEYLNRKYPYDREIVAIPADDPRAYFIVEKIMCDMIDNAGISSFTSYSENGMSWRRDKVGLSSDIIALIVPKAGVPK